MQMELDMSLRFLEKKVQQSPVENLNVNTTRQVIGRGNLLNTGF